LRRATEEAATEVAACRTIRWRHAAFDNYSNYGKIHSNAGRSASRRVARARARDLDRGWRRDESFERVHEICRRDGNSLPRMIPDFDSAKQCFTAALQNVG